jgi:succinoglycan biosynthesis protein ExoL
MRRRDRIVFFAPDFSDVNVIRRVATFQAAGWRVLVPGFFRRRYHRDYQPPWPHVVLGHTVDGRHKLRALMLLQALLSLWRLRHELAAATAFYARNLDQLALAIGARALAGTQAPVIYESLDVPDGCTHPGLKGRILRFAEQRLLQKAALLVVSSPAFVHHYYAGRLGWAGPWHLLENKLPTASPPPQPAARRPGWRWTVGYVGLIRGRRTVELIAEAARRSPDVLFVFRGIFTTVSRETFDGIMQGLANVRYEGEYRNPADLAGIYRELDFVWAIDLENADHNSRWLLPCRFYEGGWHGVPCLAAQGFEVGKRVAADGLGWTFAEPYAAGLAEHFSNLTAEAWQAVHRRLADHADLFASDDQGQALCRRISDLCAGMSDASAQAPGVPRKPVATT